MNLTLLECGFKQRKNILGYKILGGDDLIPELVHNTYFLITVGQIKNNRPRKNIKNFKKIMQNCNYYIPFAI